MEIDLTDFGWAPGGYLKSHCLDCKKEIWNCDKYAWRCEPCAMIRYEKYVKTLAAPMVCDYDETTGRITSE